MPKYGELGFSLILSRSIEATLANFLKCDVARILFLHYSGPRLDEMYLDEYSSVLKRSQSRSIGQVAVYAGGISVNETAYLIG